MAARTLPLQILYRHVIVEFIPVQDAQQRVAIRRNLPFNFLEARWLTHRQFFRQFVPWLYCCIPVPLTAIGPQTGTRFRRKRFEDCASRPIHQSGTVFEFLRTRIGSGFRIVSRAAQDFYVAIAFPLASSSRAFL